MDGNDHPAHTEFEQIQPEISALFHGGSLLLTVVFDIIANEIPTGNHEIPLAYCKQMCYNVRIRGGEANGAQSTRGCDLGVQCQWGDPAPAAAIGGRGASVASRGYCGDHQYETGAVCGHRGSDLPL
jgi:hypothetical protein